MIYLEADGGLCNRMRAINSAYKIAQETNHKLSVLWKLNETLNCPYEELFQLPDDIAITNVPNDNFLRKALLKIWRKMQVSQCDLFFDDERIYTYKYKQIVKVMTKPWVFNKLSDAKNIYIYSGEEIIEYDDVDIFTPNKEILDCVEAIEQSYEANCIGVHIRRTDMLFAIQRSTTEAFVARMQKEIEENPSVSFYLATDDASEEQKLIDLFGSRIIVGNKTSLDRNTTQGIKDAYIELLCLAKTEKILGSFMSSFSVMASKLGAIPLEVVIDEGLDECGQRIQ